MKNHKKNSLRWARIALGAFLITFGTLCLIAPPKTAGAPVEAHTEPVVTWYQPTHRQLVWRYALEWCESGGRLDAVNPKDRDNTASYYSFQWKPGTFKGYALQYKILPIERLDTLDKVMKEMENYDTQVLIVNEMIHNREKINWKNEFPDCVRKHGIPPSN